MLMRSLCSCHILSSKLGWFITATLTVILAPSAQKGSGGQKDSVALTIFELTGSQLFRAK